MYKRQVKIVKYENMLREPVEVLGGILDFYEISITQDRVEQIVNESTPVKLRAKRIESGLEGLASNGSDVRQGKAEGWIVECPADSQLKIQKIASKELTALGYQLRCIA